MINLQVLKDEIRNSIIDSAQEIFLESGFEKTSMKAIADRVGISKGNLYNYFKSKEEIFCYITSPARNLLDKAIDHFMDTNYLITDTFSDELANAVKTLLKERQGMLLILTCAEGTGSENIIDAVINTIAEKILSKIILKQEYAIISQVIAQNLVSGIIQIFLKCPSDDEVINNVRLMAKYHIEGCKTLL